MPTEAAWQQLKADIQAQWEWFQQHIAPASSEFATYRKGSRDAYRYTLEAMAQLEQEETP